MPLPRIHPPIVLPQEPQPGRTLAQGLQHHRAGNLVLAEQAYRSYLSEEPEHPQALAFLANTLARSGQFQQAIECASRALRSAPYLGEARFILGAALLGLSHPDKALVPLTQAYALGHPQASTWLEGLLGRLGTSARTFSLRLQADLLLSLGKPIEAFGVTLTAIDLEPDNDLNWVPFGRCLTLVTFNSKVDRNTLERIQQAFQRDGMDYQNMVRAAVTALHHEDTLRPLFSADNTGNALREYLIAGKTRPAAVNHSLLCTILQRALINDLDLELRLTALRRVLLVAVAGSTDDMMRDCHPFLESLALQCFINEYVFHVTPQEVTLLDRLRARFAEEVALTDKPSAVSLSVLAAYEPLHKLTFSRELVARTWPEWISKVVHWQLTEPLEERAIQETIPLLSPIEGELSREVRSQYEENPFPRWITLPALKEPVTLKDHMSGLFPALDTNKLVLAASPEILVAGCGTGMNSAILAHQIRGAKITAVDLSLSSLAYAIRKSRELGLDNIRYIQGDILALDALGQQFDFINCFGVLHHMKDVLEGWRSLVNVLRPGGCMQIGLYSAIARRAVTRAREYAADGGFNPNIESMRACRQAMILDQDDELVASVVNSCEFYNMSNFRDLAFHYQEHQLRLPEIRDMIEELGLEFIGFALDDLSNAIQYQRMFPQDPNMLSLELWDQFERYHPTTFRGCYNLWVHKPGCRPSE